MTPVGSSSIPGAVTAAPRAKTGSDTPAVSALISTYGNVPAGTDGYILQADSTNPAGFSFIAPAANSVAYASIRNSVAQPVGNNATVAVTFSTKDRDTNGFWNAGSPSQFTIPALFAGWYDLEAFLAWDSSTAGARQLAITVNGAQVANDEYAAGTIAGDPNPMFAARKRFLNVGDVIAVQAWQNSGVSLNIETTADRSAYLTITRLTSLVG